MKQKADFEQIKKLVDEIRQKQAAEKAVSLSLCFQLLMFFKYVGQIAIEFFLAFDMIHPMIHKEGCSMTDPLKAFPQSSPKWGKDGTVTRTGIGFKSSSYSHGLKCIEVSIFFFFM